MCDSLTTNLLQLLPVSLPYFFQRAGNPIRAPPPLLYWSFFRFFPPFSLSFSLPLFLFYFFHSLPTSLLFSLISLSLSDSLLFSLFNSLKFHLSFFSFSLSNFSFSLFLVLSQPSIVRLSSNSPTSHIFHLKLFISPRALCIAVVFCHSRIADSPITRSPLSNLSSTPYSSVSLPSRKCTRFLLRASPFRHLLYLFSWDAFSLFPLFSSVVPLRV